MAKRYARIAGTGHYLPRVRMTNEEASKKIGVQLDPWLSTTTGITARHLSAPYEVTSDLAAAACRYEVIRGVGHLPNRENPPEFDGVLLGFLKGVG